MRFLPCIFMVADEEDFDAHGLLLQIFFDRLGDKAAQITDGFLDNKCLISAQKICGNRIYLHRCLQHTTANVKCAARAKDEKGGKPRLSRQELPSKQPHPNSNAGSLAENIEQLSNSQEDC